MSAHSSKKPLTLGDFVEGGYRVWGKRKANGLIRLAIKLRIVEFRRQHHFLTS